jgi:hypothetical protein
MNLSCVVIVVIEQVMIHPPRVLSRETKADGRPNVLHDLSDIGSHVGRTGVGKYGLVSAPDVEPDPGRADENFRAR